MGEMATVRRIHSRPVDAIQGAVLDGLGDVLGFDGAEVCFNILQWCARTGMLLSAARSDPSLRKERLLGMTIKVRHYLTGHRWGSNSNSTSMVSLEDAGAYLQSRIALMAA